MGIYINPGNDGFTAVRASRYVDKSGLIAAVNGTVGTLEKLNLVSRARRFGKSTAAKMLCAYYDCSCDSSKLFDDLEIARDPSYHKHLNKYNVMYLDITGFIGEAGGIADIIPRIKKCVTEEIVKQYPQVTNNGFMIDVMAEAAEVSRKKFIAIIDEWDAVVRDTSATAEDKKKYLEFLRSLFKNSGTTDKTFAAAYMTGILPVKKDGSQSAISEFREYTMINPREFGEYVGFTEAEVKALCKESGADFCEMKRWYDGYSFKNVISVYNPNSVMNALKYHSYESYWAWSSSTTSLLDYINMDFDGLADTAVDLLAGKRVPVEVLGFNNDPEGFASKDDVLTLLIHYGYLSYDAESETVRIPNEEIRSEFSRVIRKVKNKETLERVRFSDKLIEDTVEMNASAVIKPALIIELKWDDSPESAINQMKKKHYPDALKGFDGPILLVGISYDKEDAEKKHHCVIEEVWEGRQ